jgi:ribosomal protein S18 acetylase RimI-like enzyme
MKGDSEWEAVTAKVQGKEPAYSQLRVACLIATAPVPSPHAAKAAAEATTPTAATNATLAARLAADLELDPSASLLPADNAASATTVEAVIGTLDVNVGAVLPAEELIGKRGRVGATASSAGSTDASPSTPPPSTRAYLSNVCVAKAARGLGVGKQLLRAAEELVVRPAGVGGLLAVPPPLGDDASDDQSNNNDDNSSFHLYVHVVHDNAAARALYEGGGGGFRVEAEETEAFARGLARPRRLLLHKRLPLPPLSSSALSASG